MKKTLAFLLVILTAALFVLSGCGSSATPAPATATVSPTATIEAKYYPFKENDIAALTYQFDKDQIRQPFWYGNVMYNETICFMQNNGTSTGKLLFTPKRILSVRDYSLKTEYQQGVDWVWNEGTKTITLPEGSAILPFTKDDLAGVGVPSYPTWDDQQRTRLGNAVYTVGEFLYGRQYVITYAYDENDYAGPEIAYQGANLPKTMAKLKNKETLTIVAYGDSILSGCDASSMYHREPNIPKFADIFAQGLRDAYGSTVQLTNLSTGGWTSQQGVDGVKKVAQRKPDLVIIAFGQNDGGLGSASITAQNDQKIMDAILEQNPDCEFILMSTLKPNADAGFLNPSVQPRLPGALKPLTKEGVILVDVYTMHEYMLKSKFFVDLTGNNINHPNDFFIRVHAMLLLSALIDYTAH